MSITKINRSKENYCMGRMGKRLCIQTTTACNGKCFFCVGRYNIPCKTNVDKIIESALELNDYKNVLLLGGESTLFPEDLIKIVNSIYPYKEKITINTNGYNLECLDPIIDKLDKLIVSIMGNETINDQIIQVKPNLNKIKEFHEKNPMLKLRTNAVICKRGMNRWQDIVDYIEEMKTYGFNSVKLSEMTSDNINDEEFIDLQELLKPYVPDLHQENTITHGCYLEPKSLQERFGIKVILNLTCNLKAPCKQSQYKDLLYESCNFDSVYISPSGEIMNRFAASQDLANDRGAC